MEHSNRHASDEDVDDNDDSVESMMSDCVEHDGVICKGCNESVW